MPSVDRSRYWPTRRVWVNDDGVWRSEVIIEERPCGLGATGLQLTGGHWVSWEMVRDNIRLTSPTGNKWGDDEDR